MIIILFITIKMKVAMLMPNVAWSVWLFTQIQQLNIRSNVRTSRDPRVPVEALWIDADERAIVLCCSSVKKHVDADSFRNFQAVNTRYSVPSLL